MYGMKGQPVIVTGRPKPKTNGKWPVLASTNIQVNVTASSSQDYPLPFAVSDPRMLEVSWQSNTVSSSSSFVPVGLLVPTGSGGGQIYVIPNSGDYSRNYTIEYVKSTNAMRVTAGAIVAPQGVLQVRLLQRSVRAEASIPDPGSTSDATLPFSISNIENVFIGTTANAATVAKYPAGYLSSADTLSWHMVAESTSTGTVTRLKLLSPTQFKRDANAISGFYIIEFN